MEPRLVQQNRPSSNVRDHGATSLRSCHVSVGENDRVSIRIAANNGSASTHAADRHTNGCSNDLGKAIFITCRRTLDRRRINLDLFSSGLTG